MFCIKCGEKLQEEVNFCGNCGNEIRATASAPAHKQRTTNYKFVYALVAFVALIASLLYHSGNFDYVLAKIKSVTDSIVAPTTSEDEVSTSTPQITITPSGIAVQDATETSTDKTEQPAITVKKTPPGWNWLLSTRDEIERHVRSGKSLRGTYLSGKDLMHTYLVEARLSYANLVAANLTGAQLQRADLTWANLSDAIMINANLSEADLSKAQLSRADLTEADLTGAVLIKANFVNANLQDADLRWANLTGANLKDANVSGADMRMANLTDADLNGVDLSKVDLEGVNLGLDPYYPDKDKEKATLPSTETIALNSPEESVWEELILETRGAANSCALSNATVQSSSVNVRAGPGAGRTGEVVYEIQSYLKAGECVTATGRNQDRSWVQISSAPRTGANGGWVAVELLSFGNKHTDIDELPIIAIAAPKQSSETKIDVISQPVGIEHLGGANYVCYNIQGNNEDELASQMDEYGPEVEVDGEYWGMLSYEYGISGGKCYDDGSVDLSDLIVSTEYTITMPCWSPPSGTNGDLIASFGGLMRHIAAHELRHIEIARKYASILQQRLKESNTCEEGKADAIWGQVLAEVNSAQDGFHASPEGQPMRWPK